MLTLWQTHHNRVPPYLFKRETGYGGLSFGALQFPHSIKSRETDRTRPTEVFQMGFSCSGYSDSHSMALSRPLFAPLLHALNRACGELGSCASGILAFAMDSCVSWQAQSLSPLAIDNVQIRTDLVSQHPRT